MAITMKKKNFNVGKNLQSLKNGFQSLEAPQAWEKFYEA